MSFLTGIDWRSMWIPADPLLNIVVRGTVMYLGLVFLFRALRPDAGNLSLADLLLVVLIADAAQNGMAGEYRSLTEGGVLVGTIAGWSYLLNWLTYRFKPVARLLTPPPLPLIWDGVMQRRNMRHELITPEEIMSQLRQDGVARLEEVQCCYLEPDGQISVIKTSRPSDT